MDGLIRSRMDIKVTFHLANTVPFHNWNLGKLQIEDCEFLWSNSISYEKLKNDSKKKESSYFMRISSCIRSLFLYSSEMRRN